MTPTMIMFVLGGVGFLLIAYLLLDSGDGKTKKRVQNLSNKKGSEKKSLFNYMKVDDSSHRRKMIESSLADLEENQKSAVKKRKSLQAKLIQANVSMPPSVFLGISVVLGVVVFVTCLLFGVKLIFALGAGFVTGFGLPRWVLGFFIKRRQKKFTAHFADAMDIIVRGVRTGLPLGDCLRIIAHESPEPVRGEFVRLVEAESVGVPLETCVERMYDRIPLAEVNFFGIVLNIQRSTGGNLGESLGNLSKVLRERKLLREKIKALSAEAKVSAIIIGALPIFVMVLVTMLSPDYMDELYNTPTGNKMLMIAAGMMVVGIVTMRKMINFKF